MPSASRCALPLETRPPAYAYPLWVTLLSLRPPSALLVAEEPPTWGLRRECSERLPCVLWDPTIKQIRRGSCALTRSLMHIQAVLRRHDPVRKAEAQRAAAGRSAQTQVVSTIPLHEAMQDEDSDFGSDDDGDDPAVKRWQQARLAELMKERGVREQLRAQNHGRLSTVRVSLHFPLTRLG
jgi:hypothetical protein